MSYFLGEMSCSDLSVMNKLSDMTSLLSAPLLPAEARLADAWRDDAAAMLAPDADETIISFIAATIYAAPHLHHALKRIVTSHPDDIPLALSGNVSKITAQAKADFSNAMTTAPDEAAVMRYIRHYRYRCYVALAIAELYGSLAISEQMTHLSDCAETALEVLLCYLCQRADIAPDSLVILGMGKLGAQELNYSSDIDLIVLYQAKDSTILAQDYVKLTRKLIALLQTQTGDGFGWRVDLRLRPDPGATAIALSVDAAISYYESLARSWERAVFVRARPVAGNRALGQAFLDEIAPFIWRRQLDYSILSDLTSWITHYPMPEGGLSFDVKRGAYGIRHIEMMTHLLQILHGGRQKSLRKHQTDKGLDALAKARHLSPEQAQQSKQLYWRWRAIEHRLQYCRDAHIYQLPNNHEDFCQFARFAGFADSASLYTYLTGMQHDTKDAACHPIITDMIAAHEGARARGAWPAEEVSQQHFLREKGYARADDIIRTIESWMSGRLPATRSERARDILVSLLPVVITEIAASDEADDHFMGFAQFLEALPAGVQVFSLLQHHPQLIDLISNFTLNAPALMHHLTKSPQIFEQMLDERFFSPLQNRPDFFKEIAHETVHQDAERQLDTIRRYSKEAIFRAEAHIITYPQNATDCHDYLTDLADAALSATFALTYAEFEAHYGTIDDGDFAILLLGRAGERQLTPQSDIDIIFLYDGDRHTRSSGHKQLSCGHYYQKLAQRFISWTTSATATGKLYEIDTRLRPEGNAGPLATHIDAWQGYLNTTAWPFEKLALRKARLLSLSATSTPFAQRIEAMITQICQTPLEQQALIKDITLLRQKMSNQRTSQWDFKGRPGGLRDCEFLHHLGDTHGDEAAQIWHHLSLIRAVTMPKHSDVQTPPALFQKELCRLMAQSDFDQAVTAMEQRLDTVAKRLKMLLS